MMHIFSGQISGAIHSSRGFGEAISEKERRSAILIKGRILL